MAFQLQMNWLPNLLSQKRKNGPPLGLKNLGNSCYLNSVLQCLTYTPPLANFCLRNQHSSLCDSASSDADRKRECPFCILERRIVRSLSLDLALDSPLKIINCLRIFAENFRFGRQEDAHEFLRYVIDACHNTCLRLKKLRRNGFGGSTVVKEIFGGALQSQLKCLSCGNDSNKVDEIMDISLDILHSSSIKEALQKFFQLEVLDGSNKYKCDNCKKLVVARKQMSILQAPNILVIQFKRFEGIYGGKIDKAIAFEENLLLSNFMCKASQDPRPEYKLFGTIVHSGFSAESGHYYAYIKDAMGRWYCCNDSFVTLSTLQEVLSEKVYILFFSRTNQRPVSASSALASNGIKSHECNGSEASKTTKSPVVLKMAQTRSHVEQSSRKDSTSLFKVDKQPFSLRGKSNMNGNSDSIRAPNTINGKLVLEKDHQSIKKNENLNNSLHVENGVRHKSSLVNGNGIKHNDAADDITDREQSPVLMNGNGNTEGVDVKAAKQEFCDVNTACFKVTASGHDELDNAGSCISEIRRSKRKSDFCILLQQDAQSRDKVEELKEVLTREGSSVLRSSGWSEEVLSFMRSRKRLCSREMCVTPSSSNDLKKLLIADARPKFISCIPESLKEDLIKKLKQFSTGDR